MLAKILCVAAAGGAILLAVNTREERGKDLFVRRCSGCHAADLNKEGPRLRGVYGRKAASAPGFAYSDALKKVDLRWDDASLGPLAERSRFDGAGHGYGVPINRCGRAKGSYSLFEVPGFEKHGQSVTGLTGIRAPYSRVPLKLPSAA